MVCREKESVSVVERLNEEAKGGLAFHIFG